MLVINFNKASFGVTLLTRWLGMPEPAFVSENTAHGAEASLRSSDPATYWDEIREYINTAIGTEQVGFLLILGTDAYDPEPLQIIRAIFEEHDFDLSLMERYDIDPSDSSAVARLKADSLFAVARQVVKSARFGMETDFKACSVPDLCNRPDEEKAKSEI